MKILKSSILIMFVVLSLFSCNAQTSDNKESKFTVNENIQVYYFHFTSRCATCNAVEDETKVALEMFYPDNMKEGTIEFTSLNLDESEGEKMAEALHVAGQTLLIISGESKVNLTNEGFMNARTNPGQFHEIIRTNIDKLL